MNQAEAEKGQCRVCHGVAAGIYFGALVCLPCKSFYIRCTKDGVKLRCQQEPSACTVNNGRFKCQACRFKACQDAGMHRKEEKPEIIDAPDGVSLCQVCGDIANGVHFGVTSCEGCKKFFRRGLTEWQNYQCKEEGNCPVNPRTRNSCRYCRYHACLKAGMSREAIKVGRPPNKKENSRHHPYGQIGLNLNHHDGAPKLYENGYMKTETAWDETPSLASLPALIHSGGNRNLSNGVGYGVPVNGSAKRDEALNSSCTSQELNNMLMGYMDSNGELNLPNNFDLEETIAQIDNLRENHVASGQRLDTMRANKLARIENLPNRPTTLQQQHNIAQQQSMLMKGGYHLQPIKLENSAMYRDSSQPYSHPSPPYEPQYDRNYNRQAASNQQDQTGIRGGMMFAARSTGNNNPSGSYIKTGLMSHAAAMYPNNIRAPPNQNWETKQPLQFSHPSPPLNFDQAAQVNQTSVNQFKQSPVTPANNSYDISNSFTSLAHQPAGLSNAANGNQGHDLSMRRSPVTDIYQQPNQSPYSSCMADSPYSNSSPSNASSGYATDFLEEFSIYDPVDIHQVNHKYMPSCSQEPLVFNEQALTVDDLWSANKDKMVKSDETEDSGEECDDVESASGNGLFKKMKSIDDKVDQSYWFDHKLPGNLEFTDNYKEELDYLMRGWQKSKDYINMTVKSEDGKSASEKQDEPSSDEKIKESYWPNVKENAPLQLKMWDFIKTKLLRGTTAQVMFYQHIRGSEKVPEEDQKTLVSTSSFTNCLLMNILYWWDEEKEQCKYFWSWKVPPSDPFYVFRQTLTRFSQAIKDMNFDEKEIMLLSALMLFSSDILRIKDKKTIDIERKPLLDLCVVYCKDKYKDAAVKRLKEMLSIAPALRYLSIWHHDLMAFAKTFGSAGLSLDKMRISES